MNTVIIIPARYESSRFPGKPLANIVGKSLIRRVWEQCIKAIDSKDVYIATDDNRIKNHCDKNNMQYIMTDKECLTGTDRVFQAYSKLNKEYDCLVNVQGDEPLIEPEDISKVIQRYDETDSAGICCGFCEIKTKEDFISPNIIKVVMDNYQDLLYASRSPIPTNKNLEFHWAYKQVCVYAFSPDIVVNNKSKSKLEMVEDIEILRFLEKGYSISMVKVSNSSISVDVPEDIIKVEECLKGGHK